jgi:predicted ABC-type sugar transport system permease subunit
MNTSTASKTETAIAKHLAIDAGPVTRLLHFLLAPAPILLLLLFALFSLTSPSFLTSFNLTNVLLHASLIGLIAIGLTPVMINGQIDLTVGSILGFAACIAVGFQGALGLWGALALALASGTLLGLLNGFIIERTGVNAFIVTLAGMIGIRGLAFVVFGDTSVSPPDTQLADIGALKIGPFSLITIIFLVAALIVGAIMRLSIHGRNTYAIGGHCELCALWRPGCTGRHLHGSSVGISGTELWPGLRALGCDCRGSGRDENARRSWDHCRDRRRSHCARNSQKWHEPGERLTILRAGDHRTDAGRRSCP